MRRTRGAKLAMVSVSEGWYTLSPLSNTTTLAIHKHLWAHVCGRVQIAISSETAFKKMWVASFTCLGRSMFQPAASLVGSCSETGGEWELGGDQIGVKMGEKIVLKKPVKTIHLFLCLKLRVAARSRQSFFKFTSVILKQRFTEVWMWFLFLTLRNANQKKMKKPRHRTFSIK